MTRGLGITILANTIINQGDHRQRPSRRQDGDDVPKPVSNAGESGQRRLKIPPKAPVSA